MKDTGERMIPERDEGTIVWGEHFARYIFAEQVVKDKTVLDIACGTGYGSFLLAKSGASLVYGIDISRESISYAKEKFRDQRIKFLVGDAQKIKLPDKSVDVVVTFETIEHVKSYKKVLSEIKRVLKKDGLLLLSTPNSKVYPTANPFHTKEFSSHELSSILESYFKNVTFYFQDNWFSSGIFKEDSIKVSSNLNSVLKPFNNLVSKEGRNCLYFVVFASDSNLKEYREIVSLQPLPADISELEKNFKQVRQQQLVESAKAKKLEEELSSIYNSFFWRMFRAIKKLKNRIKSRIKN